MLRTTSHRAHTSHPERLSSTALLTFSLFLCLISSSFLMLAICFHYCFFPMYNKHHNYHGYEQKQEREAKLQ